MTKQLIEKSGITKQINFYDTTLLHHCNLVYLLLRHFNKFSFFTRFNDNYIIKVSNKIIYSLNRIYLKEYYILLFIQ